MALSKGQGQARSAAFLRSRQECQRVLPLSALSQLAHHRLVTGHLHVLAEQTESYMGDGVKPVHDNHQKPQKLNEIVTTPDMDPFMPQDTLPFHLR